MYREVLASSHHLIDIKGHVALSTLRTFFGPILHWVTLNQSGICTDCTVDTRQLTTTITTVGTIASYR